MWLNLFMPFKKDSKTLRVILKRLGPSWLSSPVRRLIQAVCLILFVALFFFFCRSYIFDYSRQDADQLPVVELFLILDPLVSVSSAIATRALVWSLIAGAVVLAIGIVFPRWFCGYVCPLGTIIDLFDWIIGKRVKLFHIKTRGWWVNLRFFILSGVLIAAVFGILLSGFVSAIPIVTRGMMYIFAPLQFGLANGWDSVPPLNTGQIISIILFIIILGLGLLRPRFWCAYLCPSGALMSLTSFIRLTDRKVENTCIKCGRCSRICPFDAIKPDFSTRPSSCTFCQTCAGVCPSHAIKFVSRWDNVNIKSLEPQVAAQPSFARRRFLFGLLGASGTTVAAGAVLAHERNGFLESYPVRPPGSVPEKIFRSQCIRCGQCLKACPGNVLQPAGIELGLDGIWTPRLQADLSGCKPYCNNCGQVCPTGAIRVLSIEEKRAARIGRAEVNTSICLPHSLREECGLCVGECAAAGYNAIEFILVGIEYNPQGQPVPGTGFKAPVVIEDKCVGCGMCQAKCHARNVKELKLIDQSAIKVSAGPDKEERLAKGSYLQLKQQREEEKKQQQPEAPENDYLPDFLR